MITGAGRGIGADIAHAVLKAGDKVVATGRKLDQLQRTFAGADPQRIALVELDVASEAQAAPAVAAAVERFGRIDVLVNNAAYGLLGRLEEVSSDDIARQFAVNVHGVMHMLRAALPVLLVFGLADASFTTAVTSEAVAAEVVATLVGSIGLVLAAPLTTAVAAYLAVRLPAEHVSAPGAHTH